MQPAPVETVAYPSDLKKAVVPKADGGQKRKASVEESRKKFIKVSDDSAAVSLTSARRIDVSDATNRAKVVVSNGHSSAAFRSGTVRDEKIFLDLKDSHLIEDLEKFIAKFGGIVEKFLSKDITCVVTSRVNFANVKAEERVLSPPLVEKEGSKKTDSGLNSNAMSRGKALLLRSNSMKSPSVACDPVQFARTWNIPVVEVTVLQKLLKRENLCRKQVSSGASKGTVKKLDKPFVKVEDEMQEYSTNFRTFEKFPSGHQSVHNNAHRAASRSDRAGGKRPKPKQKNSKKPGYCECCDLMFTDQAEHFQSPKHRAFVAHSENFASLDALVSKLPSLEMFVQAMELGVTGMPLVSKYSSAADNVALCCGFLDSYMRKSMLEPPPLLPAVPLGMDFSIPGSDVAAKVCSLVSQESKLSGKNAPIKSSAGKKRKSKTGTFQKDSFDKISPPAVVKSTLDAAESRIGDFVVRESMDIDRSCNNSPVDLSLMKRTLATVLDEKPPISSACCLPNGSNLKDVDTSRTSDTIAASASKIVETVSKNCDLSLNERPSEHTPNSLNLNSDAVPHENVITKSKNIESNDFAKTNCRRTTTATDSFNKDDDLEFSSDEVSDSADDKFDWRATLRNSCNKVLNILEDSISSKDSPSELVKPKINPVTKQVDGDCQGTTIAQNQAKIEAKSPIVNSRVIHDESVGSNKNISVETKEFVSTNDRPLDESCASKSRSNGGFVRPWEFVSTKPSLLRQQSDTTECISCQLPESAAAQTSKSTAEKERSLKVKDRRTKQTDKNPELISEDIQEEDGRRSSASPAEFYVRPPTPTLCPKMGSNDKDLQENGGVDASGAEIQMRRCTSPSGDSESSVEVDVEGCDDRSVDMDNYEVMSTALRPESSPKLCDIGDVTVDPDLVVSDGLDAEHQHNGTDEVKTLSSFVDFEQQNPGVCSAPDSRLADDAVFNRTVAEISEQKNQNQERDYQNARDNCTEFANERQDSETNDEAADNNLEISKFNHLFVVENQSSLEEEIDEETTGSQKEDQRTAQDTDNTGENLLIAEQKESSNRRNISDQTTDSVASVVTSNGEKLDYEDISNSVENFQPSCLSGDISLTISQVKVDNNLSIPVSFCGQPSDDLAANRSENLDSSVVGDNNSTFRRISADGKNLLSPCDVSEKEVPVLSADGRIFLSLDLPDPSSLPCRVGDSEEKDSGFGCADVELQPRPSEISEFREISAAAVVDRDSPHGDLQNCDPSSSLCSDMSANVKTSNEPSSACLSSRTNDAESAVPESEGHVSTILARNDENPEICVDDCLNKRITDAGLERDTNGTGCGGKNSAEPAEPEKGRLPDEAELSAESAICSEHSETSSAPLPYAEASTAVAGIKAYPDLMCGIDESTDRVRMQMPDLLILAKNDRPGSLPAAKSDAMYSSGPRAMCGFAPTFGGDSSESGVADLPFGEFQVDFLDQNPSLITLYGVTKDEKVPSSDISQIAVNCHEDKVGLDSWPDELVNVGHGDWLAKDGLIACAPIATPPYSCFEEEPSKLARPLPESRSAASLAASVSSEADSSVLDDDVLTTLSRILEDASKEWQAERQKTKPTNDKILPFVPNCALTDSNTTAQLVQDNLLYDKLNLATISNFVANDVERIDPAMAETKTEHSAGSENMINHRRSDDSEVTIDATELDVANPIELIENSASAIEPIPASDRTEVTDTSQNDPACSAKSEEDEHVDLDRLMDMLRELNGEKNCSNEFEFKPGFGQTCSANGVSKSVPASFCDSLEKRQLLSAARKSGIKKMDPKNRSLPTFCHDETDPFRASVIPAENRVDPDAAGDRVRDDNTETKKFLWKVISVCGLKIRARRFPVSPEYSENRSHLKSWSVNNFNNKKLTVRFARNRSNGDSAAN